jgi:Rha family phage regulatory protein
LNQLVFIQNDQVVTDSLKVGSAFGKRHADVMRDIRELGCSEDFRQRNFAQSTYVNAQNRNTPMYHMNKKGFTLLVMGYTGSEAMEFKEAYIDQFEAMEEELKKPRVLTEKEQLLASMKLSIETSEELSVIKNDVALLQHQVNHKITLDHGEQQTLNHEIKKRVESIDPDYEEFLTKQKLYSQIHSHLRRAFSSPSYRVVKQKDFSDAVAWVKSWRPLL